MAEAGGDPGESTLDDYKRYTFRSSEIKTSRRPAGPQCPADAVRCYPTAADDGAGEGGKEMLRRPAATTSPRSTSCFPCRWKRRRRGLVATPRPPPKLICCQKTTTSSSDGTSYEVQVDNSVSTRHVVGSASRHYLKDRRPLSTLNMVRAEMEEEAVVEEVEQKADEEEAVEPAAVVVLLAVDAGSGETEVVPPAPLVQSLPTRPPPPPLAPPPVPAARTGAHSQVEYRHYLIADIDEIYRMPAYWGVMDRYEAEAVLEDKPEGSFLLRDSAQEDFVFSVSFRRFKRTLHARLEILHHRFTFDSHDPNIFSALSVRQLLEHYKDPVNCMFYQPMCCLPIHRRPVFSLQDLCRARIASVTSYDGMAALPLPRRFIAYLRYYHYRVPIRASYFAT